MRLDRDVSPSIAGVRSGYDDSLAGVSKRPDFRRPSVGDPGLNRVRLLRCLIGGCRPIDVVVNFRIAFNAGYFISRGETYRGIQIAPDPYHIYKIVRAMFDLTCRQPVQ